MSILCKPFIVSLDFDKFVLLLYLCCPLFTTECSNAQTRNKLIRKIHNTYLTYETKQRQSINTTPLVCCEMVVNDRANKARVVCGTCTICRTEAKATPLRTKRTRVNCAITCQHTTCPTLKDPHSRNRTQHDEVDGCIRDSFGISFAQTWNMCSSNVSVQHRSG